MPFNDTTNGTGLIQSCEFWTNLGTATISGTTATLKSFTLLINNAFDNILPYLLSDNDFLRWDDINNADLPIATFTITSGQSDYTISADDNSLDILNITDVRILQSATATEYTTLREMMIDDQDALSAMSPNPSQTGVPSAYLKRGNTIFLYPKPNYTSTGKIFFERIPSYFVYNDTTKKAGIPKHFHSLLSIYASYDWLLVNKPDNQLLISRVEAKIKEKTEKLDEAISIRYPTEKRLKTGWVSSR